MEGATYDLNDSVLTKSPAISCPVLAILAPPAVPAPTIPSPTSIPLFKPLAISRKKINLRDI